MHGSLAVSWKYETSSFEPVTKIERQGRANKAHKHRGAEGGQGSAHGQKQSRPPHFTCPYSTHTHTYIHTQTTLHNHKEIELNNTYT